MCSSMCVFVHAEQSLSPSLESHSNNYFHTSAYKSGTCLASQVLVTFDILTKTSKVLRPRWWITHIQCTVVVSGNVCIWGDRDEADSVTESDSEDSGGPNRRINSLVKKSNGPSTEPSDASKQESRAKSRSLRKISRAANSPTKSPGKVVPSTRGLRSNRRASLADAKPVSPRHGLGSPAYSPFLARRQSINIPARKPIGPPRTFTDAKAKASEPHRPSRYISSSHPSQHTPQISLNAFHAPGDPCPFAIPSSGLPVSSESNLFEPSFARRASRRSSRHGGQVTHQSPPNPWSAHLASNNPYASFPKTGIPSVPIVPGLMAPPAPLTGPLLETPLFPPPPSTGLMPSQARHKAYTQSKLEPRLSIKKTRYVIDKDSNTPRKRKSVGTSRKASKFPTTTQSTPRTSRTEKRIRRAHPPPAEDAPSSNTRAMAIKSKRRGQRLLVKGRRFGYEELEEVEKEARRISKARRE